SYGPLTVPEEERDFAMSSKYDLRQIGLILCWVIAISAVSACKARAEAATVGLEAIIQGMEHFDNHFNGQASWFVKYRHERDMRAVPPGIAPEAPAREVVNARKGKWLYYSIESAPSNRFKEGEQEWCAWKDDVCVLRRHDHLWIFAEPAVRA